MTYKVHVDAGLLNAALADNASRHANSHAMAGQVCHHHTACSHLTAGTYLNGPQDTHTRAQKHSVSCKHTWLISPDSNSGPQCSHGQSVYQACLLGAKYPRGSLPQPTDVCMHSPDTQWHAKLRQRIVQGMGALQQTHISKARGV